MHIMVVEDNELLRNILTDMLSSSFDEISVSEASEGGTVLKKIEQTPPDVIVMDIQLPGMNGIELTRRIKKEYPDIEIIIYTDYDQPEYRKAGSEAGAEYFLSKADPASDLVMLIETMLV